MPEPNCACAAGSSAAPSPMASAVRTSFFIALSFFLCGWCGKASQQYRVTAVRQEFLSASLEDGRPLACTACPVLFSCRRARRSRPPSASRLSAFLRSRRSHRGSPWHRSGIPCCIEPVTSPPFPLCSDIRQGRESIGIRGRQRTASKISLKRLWNRVVRVRRKKQVLGKVHFDAVALPNRDGRWYLHEAIEDRGRGLRDAGRSSVGECLRTAGGDGATALRDLAGSGNHSQSDRGAEDFQVMVIDLVF